MVILATYVRRGDEERVFREYCGAIRRVGRFVLPCELTGPHEVHIANHYGAADGDRPAMQPLPEPVHWTDRRTTAVRAWFGQLSLAVHRMHKHGR